MMAELQILGVIRVSPEEQWPQPRQQEALDLGEYRRATVMMTVAPLPRRPGPPDASPFWPRGSTRASPAIPRRAAERPPPRRVRRTQWRPGAA